MSSIDGISYASSQNVYDNLGLGILTDILYFDSGGQQVADRHLFSIASSNPTENLQYGAKTALPGGGFTVQVTGFHDVNGFEIDSFKANGELTAVDSYSGSPGAGQQLVDHDAVQLSGPGSAGQVNGGYFDAVVSFFNAAGQLTERSWYNTVNSALFYSPLATEFFTSPTQQDLLILLPAQAVVAANSAQPIQGIDIVDAWAAGHPGSLALDLRVASGSLAMSGAANSGQSLHVVGTLSQLEADLATLTYSSSGAANSDTLTVSVWNQAGVNQVQNLAITIGTPTSPPGPNDLSVAVPAALSVAPGQTTAIVGVAVNDAWAANHPGTLAVLINDNSGTLTLPGASGSGSNGLEITGTLAQINSDLAALTYRAAQSGGSDVITVSAWNQAGVNVVGIIHETNPSA